MNSDLTKFLVDMSEHAHYPAFLEEVGAHRPVVPLFDPVKGNVDEWKLKSGRRQGYDLLASLLKIKFGD